MDDAGAFGFLRARTQAAELAELGARSHGMKPAVRAAAIRELLGQIMVSTSARPPVPEFVQRVEDAIARDLEGSHSFGQSLFQCASMLAIAVETARVGVEQGLDPDYWRQPHSTAEDLANKDALEELSDTERAEIEAAILQAARRATDAETQP